MGLGAAADRGRSARLGAVDRVRGARRGCSTRLFRRRLHERLVGQPPGLEPELVGESGVALAAIAPGAQGSVELRGTTWQARNVGTEPLAARAPVRVTAVRGILLEVRG